MNSIMVKTAIKSVIKGILYSLIVLAFVKLAMFLLGITVIIKSVGFFRMVGGFISLGIAAGIFSAMVKSDK